MGDPTMPQVPFGELFDDENVQQHYEGLAATLKAAKKREWSFLNKKIFIVYHPHPFPALVSPKLQNVLGGIVTYTSPILLKGAHDTVLIDLVDKSPLGTMGNDLEELKRSGADAKLNMERS